MTKKRVHEIAKEQGLSSKELLEKLKAAGVQVKAAASSIDEASALKALGINGSGAPAATANGAGADAPPTTSPPAKDAKKASASPTEKTAAAQTAAEPPPTSAGGEASTPDGTAAPASETAADRVRPTRDSRQGERAPGGAGAGDVGASLSTPRHLVVNKVVRPTSPSVARGVDVGAVVPTTRRLLP